MMQFVIKQHATLGAKDDATEFDGNDRILPCSHLTIMAAATRVFFRRLFGYIAENIQLGR